MDLEVIEPEEVKPKSATHHTVIQVIGVGGGGSNAVQRMIEYGLEGVEFIMANTDLQALERFQSPKTLTLPLGEKVTGGLGAGGKPEIGREAAEEDLDKIRTLLDSANMVFVTAGMGGGTGTGGAPVIAQTAKEMGKLCVGVVTTPFHFEGQRKYQLALQGLEELRKVVDTLIVIPNQLLLQVLDAGTSVREAFMNADEVLRMGVKGIADLIIQPGDINVDFNDVCTVMRNGGKALMGIGICSGEDRAEQATRQALENPLLSGAAMQGATGLLVQITADESFSLDEYSVIMDKINDYVDTMSANVISGIAIDSQKKDEIKVTVIATGFHEEEQKEIKYKTQNFHTNVPANKSRGYAPRPHFKAQEKVQEPKNLQVAMQSPLESPLQKPLSTPMQPQHPTRAHSRYSGHSPVNPSHPSQTMARQQHNRGAYIDETYASYAHERMPIRENDYGEAGQASQMRQALQPEVQPNFDLGKGTQLAQAPDRVYQMTQEDNRFVEEQQVSNTELQLLFSEANPSNHAKKNAHANQNSFGQKRAEPQLPPGQSEDLYIPTLLRRKSLKQR